MDSELLRKRISEIEKKDDFSHFLITLGKRKGYSVYRLKSSNGTISYIAADRKTIRAEKKDPFPLNPFAEARFDIRRDSEGKKAHITCAYTDEEKRKLGIQRVLFSLIGQEAKDRGAEKLELRADGDMADFYRKMGFKRVLKTGDDSMTTFVKEPKFENFRLRQGPKSLRKRI